LPALAVNCLLDYGGSYPLAMLISALSQLAASEDGRPLLPVVIDDFWRYHDNRRSARPL